MAGHHLLLSLTLAALLAPGPIPATELHDPMRPPQARAKVPAKARPATPAPPGYVLESTLVGGQRRSAVINGRAVQAGDRIPGARVLRIEADMVELDTGGKRLRLRTPNPVKKSESTGNPS